MKGVGVSPFDPGSDPWFFVNKSQDIVPTEQASVGNTFDADAVSPEISLWVTSRTRFM